MREFAISMARQRTRTLATLALSAGAMALISSAAVADPPGNNGTIKIDSQPFDDAPDNEPHVGCVFQVDFYGFDEGDVYAAVTFRLQPPTGKGTVVKTDSVFVGEDAAGGGTDLDASATYDFNDALTAVEPHPKQGFHLKVEADTGGNGKGKSKVFWVTDCQPGSTGGGGST
jgi:hypothetical protein